MFRYALFAESVPEATINVLKYLTPSTVMQQKMTENVLFILDSKK